MITYKNGFRPTIYQGVCSVNSSSSTAAHRNRSVFVSLASFCYSLTFLSVVTVLLQAKRNRTCWPSRHIHLVPSVPTSHSHFLIQLALCSPTVKVKVCELLRGGPLRERECVCEREHECVCVYTSQVRTSALTKKWLFQAGDKWLAVFIDAFTQRCGFSDKIINAGQVTSWGISCTSMTINYSVFTKKQLPLSAGLGGGL